MAMSMKEKHVVTREMALRYRKARKKEKGRMLDELVKLTGYTRCYARFVVRRNAKNLWIKGNDGKPVRVVADTRKKAVRKKKKLYGPTVFTALRTLWIVCDCICGKRLAPYLKEFIQALERHGELTLKSSVREKLLTISAATIDRMLRGEKKTFMGKGKSWTKPGTLLKHQIPIRTFSEWEDVKPGFLEMDLVGHEGGATTSADVIQTLDMTDVSSAWTETQAVRNKAEVFVFDGIETIRKRLPFDILGLDSDNGSEFINDHLFRYCQDNQITFTRGRPYRKNDSCYVEQKNYSIVRRHVGYLRYDTDEELALLNALYRFVRLYTNFFQPVMKLLKKERHGSRVRKHYDTPTTPYQRLMSSPFVEAQRKDALKKEYELLNPAELKRKITKGQQKLIRYVQFKEILRRKIREKKQSHLQ